MWDGNQKTTQDIENIVGREKGRVTYWKDSHGTKNDEAFGGVLWQEKSCYSGRKKETYSGTELDRDIKHSTTEIERYTHRHYTEEHWKDR